MSGCRHEPSLSQILDDPMMQALMESDRVDPHAFGSLIAAARRRIADADGDKRPDKPR